MINKLFNFVAKLALKFSKEDVIKSMISFIQEYMKQHSENEIRYLFDYNSHKKISDAFACRNCFGEFDKDNKYLDDIYELAEYIWCKDETPISKSSIMDALVTQIKNGISLEELQNKSKWDLISDVHDIICY